MNLDRIRDEMVKDPGQLTRWLDQLVRSLNCPSFRVERLANQTGIVTSTITIIQFDTVVFDTHNAWDGTLFQYNPKVAGTYVFGVQCRFVASVAGAATNALIYRNSTFLQNVRALSVGAIGPDAVAVGMFTMNGSSDAANFRTFQDTGVNQALVGASQETNAWGFRLPG